MKSKHSPKIGQERRGLVLARKDRVGFRHRPFDADSRIVPAQISIIRRAVIGIDLVGDHGVRLQGAEAVGEASRHEELRPARSVEPHRDMTPEGGGVGAEIDGDIEDRAGEHPDQLGLGIGRHLEVQPPDRTGGRGEGLVVLNEGVGDPVLGQQVGAVNLREPAAVVPVPRRDHALHRWDLGLDHLHHHPCIAQKYTTYYKGNFNLWRHGCAEEAYDRAFNSKYLFITIIHAQY